MSTVDRPGKSHTPVRQCVMTRQRSPQHALVRLVVGPDGRPYVDLLGRAPGRGVYVQAIDETLRQAVMVRGIGRAFKGRAQPLTAVEAQHLVEDTVRRLTSRILDLIGVARRAGHLEIGMDSVCDAIRRSHPGWVVLIAEDLGPSSLRRIEEVISRAPHSVARVRVGTKSEIGSRLGRTDVGVVAVRPSHHSKRVVQEAERRAGILGSTMGSESRVSGKSEVK